MREEYLEECGREGERVDDEERWSRTTTATFVKGATVELVLCCSDEVIVDAPIDDENVVAKFILRRNVDGRNRDEWQAKLLRAIEVSLAEGGLVVAVLSNRRCEIVVVHVSRPPDAWVKQQQRAPDHQPMQVDLTSGDEKKEQKAAASSSTSTAQPLRPEKGYKEDRAEVHASRGGVAHRGGGKGKRDDDADGSKAYDFSTDEVAQARRPRPPDRPPPGWRQEPLPWFVDRRGRDRDGPRDDEGGRPPQDRDAGNDRRDIVDDYAEAWQGEMVDAEVQQHRQGGIGGGRPWAERQRRLGHLARRDLSERGRSTLIAHMYMADMPSRDISYAACAPAVPRQSRSVERWRFGEVWRIGKRVEQEEVKYDPGGEALKRNELHARHAEPEIDGQ